MAGVEVRPEMRESGERNPYDSATNAPITSVCIQAAPTGLLYSLGCRTGPYVNLDHGTLGRFVELIQLDRW